MWRVWVCACAVWGVRGISGSRTRASVWHSCCFAFRKKTERSKKFFLDLQAKEPNTTMINPKPCGHLCCCIIKGCEQVRLTHCDFLSNKQLKCLLLADELTAELLECLQGTDADWSSSGSCETCCVVSLSLRQYVDYVNGKCVFLFHK